MSMSRHVFLFPFSWQQETKKQRYTSLKHNEESLLKSKYSGWQKISKKIDTFQGYNEKVYFYKTAQNLIYPKVDEPLVDLYQSTQIKEDALLDLETQNKHYELQLKPPILKLYKNGVGILHLEINNNVYIKKEDVLAINGISKAVYPFVLPLEQAWEDYFPRALTIKSDRLVIKDSFDEGDFGEVRPIAYFIMALLGDDFVCYEKEMTNERLYIETLFGNRMFTVCSYYNEVFLEALKQQQVKEAQIKHFVAFTKQEKVFPIQTFALLKTFYGVGRFSLVGITRATTHERFYNELMTLAVVQKASLLHFSNQIAYISTLPKERLAHAMSKVYEDYVQFLTQMYFREVTADILGSHLYDTLRQALRMEEELKELDFEMQEVHEYSTLAQNKQAQFRMDLLTVVGTLLVIPTFVTGFFGMNILEDRFMRWWTYEEIRLFLNSYMLLPILVVLLIYTAWTGYHFKKILLTVLLVGIILSMSTVFLRGCGLG